MKIFKNTPKIIGRIILKSEKGFFLIAALTLLAALTVLGATGFLLSSTDIKIGGNFKNSTQLLYAAMAGIERGRETLRATNAASANNCSFSDELAGRVGTNGVLDGYTSSSDDVKLVTGSLNSSTYNVYLTNDSTDGTSNQTDTNGKVLLTSVATGTNNGKAVIQSVISLNACAPSPPAAVSIVGEAETSFSGNQFSIDGRDYLMNGTLSGLSPKKGISISDISAPSFQTPATALAGVNTSLVGDANQVQGLGYVANTTPSVALDSTVNKPQVTQWVNQVASIADNLITLKSGGDVSGPISSNTDSNNNLNLGSKTINLGTTANPKITILDGVVKGSVQADFQGNISGAGILIVRNNDLIFRNQIDWKGLVIVEGSDVGFGSFGGGGSQAGIYGGVIICENDTDVGYNELVMKGHAIIRNSKEALTMIQTMVSNKSSLTTVSWKHSY